MLKITGKRVGHSIPYNKFIDKIIEGLLYFERLDIGDQCARFSFCVGVFQALINSKFVGARSGAQVWAAPASRGTFGMKRALKKFSWKYWHRGGGGGGKEKNFANKK